MIGGDGSLTGADFLRFEKHAARGDIHSFKIKNYRKEWNHYVQELLQEGQISEFEAKEIGSLALVGLVGSIDNDMYGTDITIGANTALERIIFAVIR